MSYTHLTPICRGRIQALVDEGKGTCEIAAIMNRSPGTISRELRRNGTRTGYEAAHAQNHYELRRKACRPGKKLDHRPLWRYVFEKLPMGWTPEQVSGRLPLDFPADARMRVSHEALYQSLYSDERMHCLIANLPQARPKRRKRGQGKTSRGPSIPNRVGIEHRPSVVDERSRFGDWEGDTVVGANQQGFVTTLVERRSLFTCLRKTLTKQAGEVAQAVVDGLSDMPASWVKTITFDNGTEFSRHAQMTAQLRASVYFAAPYASYQRGTNENTNGLLRRYLSKGTDLRSIGQNTIDSIAAQLNDRPRKKLAYRTPNEVLQQFRQQARVALAT